MLLQLKEASKGIALILHSIMKICVCIWKIYMWTLFIRVHVYMYWIWIMLSLWIPPFVAYRTLSTCLYNPSWYASSESTTQTTIFQIIGTRLKMQLPSKSHSHNHHFFLLAKTYSFIIFQSFIHRYTCIIMDFAICLLIICM